MITKLFHKYYLQLFIYIFPVLVSSLTVLICFPGNYNYDFVRQHKDTFPSLLSFSQHPIFSSLVLHYLALIFNSSLALQLVHLILFSTSAILLSYVLKNFHLRNRYIIIFNLLYSTFPFALVVMISSVKDTIVAFSLLILIAWLILQFQYQKFPWFVVFLMTIFTIFISLQRSLFIIWIIGLFISALFFLKFNKWKIITLISLSLLGTFFIDKSISSFMFPEGTEIRVSEGISLPVQIDGYILSRDDLQIDNVDADYFYSLLDKDYWKENYNSSLSDPLKLKLGWIDGFSAKDFLWHSLRICWDNKLLCWQGFVTWESNAFKPTYGNSLDNGMDALRVVFNTTSRKGIWPKYEHYFKNPDSYIPIFCINHKLDCSNPETYSEVQTFLSFFQYHEPVVEEKTLIFTQSPIKSKTLDQLVYWYLYQFSLNKNPVNPFYFFLFSTLILFLTRSKKNSQTEISANSFIQTPVFLTQARNILSFLNFFFWWFFLLCQITVPVFYARYFIAPILLESFILILSMWYYGKWFQMRDSLNFNSKISTVDR